MSISPAFVVAIPSKGRSKIARERTISFLLGESVDMRYVYVFVVESEEAEYRSALSDSGCRIVVGKSGLVPQRNFITEYFEEGQWILSLDDDVKEWDKSLSPTFKESTFSEFILRAFVYTQQQKAFIWSVYPTFNPFYRGGRLEVSHYCCLLIGAFFGFINRRSFLLPFEVSEKEDVRRSLLFFLKDGIVIRFNTIGFKTIYFGRDGGGLGKKEDRLAEAHRQTMDITTDPLFSRLCYAKEKAGGLFDVAFRSGKAGAPFQVDQGKPSDLEEEEQLEQDEEEGLYEGSVFGEADGEDEEPNYEAQEEEQVQEQGEEMSQITLDDAFNRMAIEEDVHRYGKKDSIIFVPLYELLENITLSIQANRGKNWDTHRCLTFGKVYRRYALQLGLVDAVSNTKHPQIYEELLKLGRLIDPDFPFNAIHINHNVTCPAHRDSKNNGRSILVSLGNYSGSRICVQHGPKEEGEYRAYNTRHRPVRFDGVNLEHYNSPDLAQHPNALDQPISKYSVVFYQKK